MKISKLLAGIGVLGGLALLVVITDPVLAAKVRTRKAKSGGAVTYTPKGVGVSVKLRPDHLGLNITFSNFDNIESGTYQLVYNSEGVQQGAGGSVIIGDSSTKEILFATCSKGACRFHENITNMRLSVVSTLKNGQTVLKPFRIRV